ncbi:hypothetical protein [Flavobacterium phycosphaerae]|uniref:hypothetical protein n=1 Tax=Flavobacterium phycosphaerae TaxID=2697515 RepID=UPI001389A156|nr:hypothetical protein [Flavobacterium phycosphaerae]
MAYLRKYCRLSANSILESVIALCIIAICLYVAVLVYAAVFTPKTSPKFYGSRNRLAEIYYMVQVNPDTIEKMSNDNLVIHQEWVNSNLQEFSINYKDSSGVFIKNDFFVQQQNEK